MHPGGKGLNQSIALAAAGASVRHAGRVGKDGLWLVNLLQNHGVDTALIEVDSGPSGHANIQVTQAGENSIVLFGGANRRISESDVDGALSATQPGDFLLAQNEISALPYLLERASDRNLRIVFNAAPMSQDVHRLPLDSIELIIINELEGAELTSEVDPEAIVDNLLSRYDNMNVLLTLGPAGAMFANRSDRIVQPASRVKAIDTTGAGDTFTGFFLAGYSLGKTIGDALADASKAAGICVTRRGAASSIPTLADLQSKN